MKYINNEKLDEYLINHSEKEPEILSDLNRETNQKVLQPRMISGAYQGRLLSIISKIINPKKILEIGTFTGYSTLCLAEGLDKNGQIHTVDINEELYDLQRKYFSPQGELNLKRQELVKPIQDKIYDAVQKLASDNKYAIIFDSSSDLIMLYSNPNLDKSDKILEILGY